MKKKGITIVSTIHQPSAKILSLFDQILILVDGKLVYDDSPGHIKERLKLLNHISNSNEPDLEYFMKVIDKDDMRKGLLQEKGEKNLVGKENMDEFEREVD